jgi:hypothetical protein
MWALMENAELYGEILASAGGIIVGLLVLFLIAGNGWSAVREIARMWPVWALGVIGLAMYMAVHLENRYSGVFFCLLWLGLLGGMRMRKDAGNRIVPAVALGIALSIVVPIAAQVGYKVIQGARSNRPDPDVQVAMQLKRLGFGPGTPVARISYQVMDLGWARLARASVVAEVEYERGDDFWEAGEKTQAEILQAFAKAGAKCVIGHPRGDMAPPGWERLGRTHFWIHRLG